MNAMSFNLNKMNMVSVYDEVNDAIIKAVILRDMGNVVDVKPIDSKHFVKNSLGDNRDFMNAWWRLSKKDKSWEYISDTFDAEKELTKYKFEKLKEFLEELD